MKLVLMLPNVSERFPSHSAPVLYHDITHWVVEQGGWQVKRVHQQVFQG